MAKTFFVAGTDTDVGKTVIACGLLAAANAKGLRSLAVKPIAAGAEHCAEQGGLRNGDALALLEAMSEKLPYQQVNPVCLEPPIAPHIAAELAEKRITIAQLVGFCRGALMKPADFKLIEGAGGWRVPVNQVESLSQLAVEMQTPVVLVVGMKLGCLNHAVLTAEAIVRDGLPLAGWVANTIDAEMPYFDENIASLKRLLPAPCLGIVPHLDMICPDKTATYINLDQLTGG